MVTFVSLFLWLVTGVQTVEVATEAPVARVEFRLDGEHVGEVTDNRRKIQIDFGPTLEPHELVAVAYDASGAEVGRDYDEIQKTWSPEVFIRESEQEIVDGGTRSFVGEPFDSWRAGNLVGTPEQVAAMPSARGVRAVNPSSSRATSTRSGCAWR